MGKGRRLTGRAIAAIGAAAAIVLTAPAVASAAVLCDFSSGLLEVRLTTANQLAQIDPGSGNLVVRDLFAPVACTGTGGTPTVSNTATISVFNEAGATNPTVILESVGGFAPGPNGNGENGGDNEIEIFVNLNDDPSGLLSIRTGAIAGTEVRVGGSGINPNAHANEVAPDVDITPNGVVAIDGRTTGSFPATFGAQGGAGTGNALTQGVDLEGGNGADSLTGGQGSDRLNGLGGADTLTGNGGTDDLLPGAGDDVMDGGTGTDTAEYTSSGTNPITVDLAIAGPQTTGIGGNDSLTDVENVLTAGGADFLRGNSAVNLLDSGGGADDLDGRGGVDTLVAGAGVDTVGVRDGGADSANCGADADTVTADALGIDTLNGCETTLFPPPPGGGSGDTGGGGVPPPPGRTATADTVRPSFTRKPRAVPTRFEANAKGRRETAVRSAGKGTSFRYSLSEAATVTFVIERRTTGQRVGGKCRKQTKANARRKRCPLFVRAGAFRATGKAGANAKAFSGRIGKTTLKPAAYRARITAADAAGNRSSNATAGFTVLKPKPKPRRTERT